MGEGRRLRVEVESQGVDKVFDIVRLRVVLRGLLSDGSVIASRPIPRRSFVRWSSYSEEPTMNEVRLTRNLGMLLLGIWLILSGLIALLSLSFQGLGTLMGVLALAAGALILAGR